MIYAAAAAADIAAAACHGSLSIHYRLKLYCGRVRDPVWLRAQYAPVCLKTRNPAATTTGKRAKVGRATSWCRNRNHWRRTYIPPLGVFRHRPKVESRYTVILYRAWSIRHDDIQRRRTAVVSPTGQPRRRQPKPADNNGHRLSDAAVAIPRKGLCVVYLLLQDRHRRRPPTTAIRHHRRRPKPRHQFLSRSVFQKVKY